MGLQWAGSLTRHGKHSARSQCRGNHEVSGSSCLFRFPFQRPVDCDRSQLLVKLSLVKMVDKIVPRNFSWLIEGRIAALAFPEKREELEFLVQQGIRYLVTLTDEMKPPVEQVPSLVSVDISVPDFATFTMDQVQRFSRICEKAVEEGKVLRNC